MVTPREYDYWKPIYRELVLLPDWSELNAEARANKLLEWIDEKLLEQMLPHNAQHSHMSTSRKAEDGPLRDGSLGRNR